MYKIQNMNTVLRFLKYVCSRSISSSINHKTLYLRNEYISHYLRIFVLEVIYHSSKIADTSNLMKLFGTLVYSPRLKVETSNIVHTNHTKPAVEVLVGRCFCSLLCLILC